MSTPPSSAPRKRRSRSDGEFDLGLAQADIHERQGSFARAFAEYSQAVETKPLTESLARKLWRNGRRAGLEPAVASALEAAMERAVEADGPALHRLLARVWRRQGRSDLARLHLYSLLAERPDDERAQAVLLHLLARERRHQELERQLQRAARDAALRGDHRAALDATLERARLLDLPLEDRPAAAVALAQAAGHAASLTAHEDAYAARLLCLRLLLTSDVSTEAREKARTQLLEQGRWLGRELQAQRDSDGLASAPPTGMALRMGEFAQAAERRRSWRLAVHFRIESLRANPASDEPVAPLRSLLEARQAFPLAADIEAWLAERPSSPDQRAEAWRRHAVLLAETLGDAKGADEAWLKAFHQSVDTADLDRHLERLQATDGFVAMERGLDRVLTSAPSPRVKAAALTVRAERHLQARRFGAAVTDWERAEALAGLNPAQRLRALEARAEAGLPGAIDELWKQAEQLPKEEAQSRAAAFRRLARLSLWPAADPERSREAWRRVLEAAPEDTEAEEKLLQAAQAAGDSADALLLLAARAKRKGPGARAARHEYARALERSDRPDEAIGAWREAALVDPTDATALLCLYERLEARERWSEAARALEAALPLLEVTRVRGEAHARLSFLHRVRMGNDALGARHAAIAREHGVDVPEPSRPAMPAVPRAVAAPAAPPSGTPVRRPRTTGPLHAIPFERAAPEALRSAVDRTPLETAGHVALAEHFDSIGDGLRARLFREVASALEGDPEAEPLPPKGTFTPAELAAVRHPHLKGLRLDGLCTFAEPLLEERAVAPRKPHAPFAFDAGKGAAVAAQALFDVVRLFGLRPPEIAQDAEEGPPFSLSAAVPPVLLVGRAAIKKPLSGAELRFHVAGALWSLDAELLALLRFDAESLDAALLATWDAVLPEHPRAPVSPLAQGIRKRIGNKLRERFTVFAHAYDAKGSGHGWEELVRAARLSRQRAGLVAAGGIAPAFRALTALRTPNDDRAELVRFAISDRYVRLRARG